MASQYDKIKTPKELLAEVAMHGLSTKQEDICRAQDIFGRSSLDELIALANDNGRMNEKGEPDPEGTWSSGREGTQRNFYSVLYHIWSWEDATRFYNTYTNPEMKKLRADLELNRSERQNLANRLADVQEDYNNLYAMHEEMSSDQEEVERRFEECHEALAKAHEEILHLKAKLYDMMTAQEVK